jgi:hypothetical protein
MDGIFATLAIASATMLLPSTNATHPKSPAETRAAETEANQTNAIVYFDAPIHSTPTYLR